MVRSTARTARLHRADRGSIPLPPTIRKASMKSLKFDEMQRHKCENKCIEMNPQRDDVLVCECIGCHAKWEVNKLEEPMPDDKSSLLFEREAIVRQAMLTGEGLLGLTQWVNG